MKVRHERVMPAVRRVARAYQAGVVAAAAAALAASIVALLAGWQTPLEGPAEFLMQWTPPAIANLLLGRLGPTARPAALLGALALVLAAGGVAGTACSLSLGGNLRRAGTIGVASLLLLLVMVTIFAGPAVSAAVALSIAFGLSLAIVSPAGERGEHALSRSAFIVGSAAGITALFLLRPLLAPVRAALLFRYHPPRGLPVPGLADLVTPAEHFYRMDKVLEYPRLDPDSWRLEIDGAVRAPVVIDFHSLLQRSDTHQYVTMECVDNPVGGSLISTAFWSGVPLERLLVEAGARGDTISFEAADNYSETVPRALAAAGGAMLVSGMNGSTLPLAHGYPARIVIPGLYGFKSVKWLTRITVLDTPQAGSWHAQGWTDTGIIQTMTRIDVARRDRDGILVAGIAFAGLHGIRAVQVRVNAGPWRLASLGPRLPGVTWVQWAVHLRGSGPGRVEARAIDRSGMVQASRKHGSYPDGATGWPSVTV